MWPAPRYGWLWVHIVRLRHHLVRIFGEDALDDRADIGLAGDDGGFVVAALDGGELGAVEAKLGLARGGVGPVAVESVFRENGLDVVVEGELGGGEADSGEAASARST